MRSAAQACEDLLAQLLSDAALRSRFKANPQGVGREFGLDAAALAALDRIDWVGLELAARSYEHKRGQHVRRKR
jgi:hypothetical protein